MQTKRLGKSQKTLTENSLQKKLNLVKKKRKLRAEVKVLRNELGEETKEKIKLEEELFKAKKILNKSSFELASTHRQEFC